MDALLQASHIAWEKNKSPADSMLPDDLRRTFVPPNLLIFETDPGVECLCFYSRGIDGQQPGRVEPLESATDMQQYPGVAIASASSTVVERPSEIELDTAPFSPSSIVNNIFSSPASLREQRNGRNSDSGCLDASGEDRDKWDLPGSPEGESVAWTKPVQGVSPTPTAVSCTSLEYQQEGQVAAADTQVFDEPTSCNPQNERTTSR